MMVNQIYNYIIKHENGALFDAYEIPILMFVKRQCSV